MEQQSLNQILLTTAFSCMACDGDIDDNEIKLIKSMSTETKMFGDINITERLNSLLEEINANGRHFLKAYFADLTHANLSEKDELQVIKVAIDTIKADDKIEYSEIKFFKIIRSKLKISNDDILETFPDLGEFLEQDIISKKYLLKLQDEFLSDCALPNFSRIEK